MAKTDHVAQGVDLLLQQFDKSPKLRALLAAFLSELQLIDDSLADLHDGNFIEQAFGQRLDILGKVVGQQRAQMCDDDYRLWIRARILLNHCQGNAEDIYKILQVVLGEDVTLRIDEHPEAVFTLSVLKVVEKYDMGMILRLINAAKPVGVSAQLKHATRDPVFIFDSPDHKNGYFAQLIKK